MNEHDHPKLRRVLRALPGEPQVPAGLAETVASRATRLRHCRTAGASGVLAASVMAAALALPGSSPPNALHTADTPPPDAAMAESPVPLPTVPPLPPPIGPQPSPSPKPTKSPKPSPTASEEPGSPAPSHGPAGPVHVRVSSPEANPETGVFFPIRVEVQTGGAYLSAISVSLGNGREQFLWGAPEPCETTQTRDDDVVAEGLIAYRAAGTYDVVANVWSLDDCDGGYQIDHDRMHLAVAQGVDVTNGPAAPQVKFTPYQVAKEPASLIDPGSRTVDVKFIGYDDDGWITKVTIDWGDGSEPTVLDYGTEGCTDSPTDWPHGSTKKQREPVRHEYGDDDRHTITMTVTSAGCGGADEQSAEMIRKLV